MLPIEKSITTAIGKFKKEIIDTFPEKNDYLYSIFDVDKKFSGKGVKIAILDTGCPKHKCISAKNKSVSFCNSTEYDEVGHSTMVSGLICAKGEMNGLANNADVYYGKIMNDNNKASFNSLVAGVLWAIVKEVDIIVLAIGTDYDYMIFHDAIKKAIDNGICVFAPSGKNIVKKDDEITYPAKYGEVFSTSFLSNSYKQNDFLKEKVDFCIPNKSIYTTYLGDKYIKIKGSSISTAIIAGISSNFIELYKKEKVNKKEIPYLLKKDLVSKLDLIKR